MITLADGTALDVAAYPLPDGIADQVMNRGQIARALNVSEPTISAWIADGMPVLTIGGNGTAYEFQLSHCYAWRMHRDGEDRAARAAADETASQMRMHFQNLDEDLADARAGLTTKQIGEESEADFKRNRAAELRGELVRADRMREMVERQMVDYSRGIMTIPDFAEMEFGLDPHQVDKLTRRCEGVLEELMLTFRRYLPDGEVRSISSDYQPGEKLI